MDEEIQIITEDNTQNEYETNSLLKKVFNFFFIPLLNNIPHKLNVWIKRSNHSAGRVIETATSHSALEILYKKGRTRKRGSFINNIFRSVWFNTNNSKAVRNRLKLVKRELHRVIVEKQKTQTEVFILSIASGSARAIFEALELPDVHKEKIKVLFLDKNEKALDYSKKLSTNVEGPNFSWVQGTAESYLRENVKDNSVDIVEMVGLLDYFNDEKVKSLSNRIYGVLKDSGVFITANIDDNKERKFVNDTIGWKMIYRSGRELALLLLKSGFSLKDMSVYYEPLEIHSVVVAKSKKS